MTRKLALICFHSILAVALAPAQTPFSAGPQAADQPVESPLVSVQGNHFVDESGKPVVFRGVSLADPHALLERGHWDRAYFEAAAAWNANIVRIPVHPASWRALGEDAYLELLDEAVRWSAELNMHVIIDWHTIGNPLTEIFHRDIYETTRAETFQFWYTIAERYRNNNTVAFYELWNEPTNRGGRMGRMPWSKFKDYMEELIYMIFKIDPTAIPLVAGFNWGYDLTSVRQDPIEFPGIAYVTHPYPEKREQPWEPKWQEDWGFVADNYPIMATEFGFMSADGPGAHSPVIGDETYGNALIDFFEERGISWTAWVFDASWSPQLIADWDFTPTRQGEFFRQKMIELNP